MLGDVGLQKLLRWSQVETSANIQTIWKDLAMAKKSQQLTILQWAIDWAKDKLGDMELQFIVSPAHIKMVKNLCFTMLMPNHVATYCTEGGKQRGANQISRRVG